MKWIFTFILTAVFATDIGRIARVNELKEEAREAYNSGDYELALKNYRYLVDSMNVTDDKVVLNMANSLYQLKDTTQAISAYQSISDSQDATVSSVAHQQLGILSNRTKKYEEALNHFKQALRKDPTNEDARYNYELLKKALDDQKKKQEEEEKKEENQQDKKDQQKKEQDEKSELEENKQNPQKKEDKEGDQEKKEENSQSEDSKEESDEEKDSEKTKEGEDEKKNPKEEKDGTPQNEEEQDKQNNEARQKEIAERLKDMKISEEKAKMILEAMKNNEIQYIQQNKRKATQKKDSSKPDW